MKKTLIAVAALAATTAFAQNVTVSGLLDAGYKMVDAPTGDNSTFAQNGSATSAIIISGTEDVGGGMKAGFRYEMNPDFVGGSGLTGQAAAGGNNTAANGYNFVNVSGNFGNVLVGRLNSAFLSANGVANPFGTAIGSGYTSGNVNTRFGAATTFQHSAPTRFNGAGQYVTPNFSGFSASLLYVPKVDQADSTTANRQGVTELGLNYANGPLAVAFAQQTMTQGDSAIGTSGSTTVTTLAAGEKSTLSILAASYQLNAFKLGAGYYTHKIDGDKADAATLRLSGSYTAGAVTAMVTYARSDDKLVANVDRTSLGLGADYALSKTAALYARYEAYNGDTNGTADVKTNTMGLGIRKNF